MNLALVSSWSLSFVDSSPLQGLQRRCWGLGSQDLISQHKMERDFGKLRAELDALVALPPDEFHEVMMEAFFGLGLIDGKRCSSCKRIMLTEHFPSKGGGRTETACKLCFNQLRWEKRHSKSGKDTPQLIYRVTVSEVSVADWCSTLAQIITSSLLHQESDRGREVASLVGGGRNAITELLKKD